MQAAELNTSVTRSLQHIEHNRMGTVKTSTYSPSSAIPDDPQCTFQPHMTPPLVLPPWPAAPTGDDARPFEPADAAPPAIAAIDAAAPASGAPDFADPFHFDWPHWWPTSSKSCQCCSREALRSG